MLSYIQPKTVVSFNYDLILDQTLQELKKLNWATEYYCPAKTIKVLSGKSLSPPRKWYGKRRPSLKNTTFLLKLHGSMHWDKMKRGDGYMISGVEKFPPTNKFRFVSTPEVPFIVPPVAAKTSISDTCLRRTWSAAHKKLKSSSVWVVWGYSFPKTDTMTSVLLKTCIKEARGKQKTIIVINPDFSVSERIKSLLVKVKIQHYASATDFLLSHNRLSLPNTNLASKPKKKK